MADKRKGKPNMPSKPNFDPRKMMEKAIEVMRQSVQEFRADGTPSPLVGAVLIRPDGSIETAARGELREGNHAEFITKGIRGSHGVNSRPDRGLVEHCAS